jgi:hypothetical protein
MLKLPPPVWALVYVLFAVAISWPLGWPKMPGFPLPPLGIALVTVPWILPVWAIIMFRREGTEINPTSPTNRELITLGPYRFTRYPMYLGLTSPDRCEPWTRFRCLPRDPRSTHCGRRIRAAPRQATGIVIERSMTQ